MNRINSLLCVSLMSMGLGVVGCAQEDIQSVPTGAMQVSSGGKIVAFTAPHSGRVYVRDDNDKRIIYSSDVKKDQVVKFDPQERAVMIDGRIAAEKIPDSNHDHSIFFERAAQPEQVEAASNGNSNVGTSNGASVPVVRVPVGVQVDVQTQPASPAK